MATRMHRPTVLLSAIAFLLLTAPPAAAQEPSPISLALVSQTPWSSLMDPTLDLRFRATNAGETTVTDLTIGVTLFGRVTSRTSYEQALLADPEPAVVIDGETLPREGTIEPGASRDFELTLDLTFPGIDPSQSGVYPLKIELRSGGLPLAALRTPSIFLVRTPEQPLALSWTFVLYQPISFAPDGIFTSTSLEQAIAPGGRLAGEIRALTGLVDETAVPIDVVASPMLLTQLARMRDGYEVVDGDQIRSVPAGEGGAATAAAALESLRRVASSPEVALSTLPFSAPQVPSLIAGGLSRDLDVQLARGYEVVNTLLGATPDPASLRPPGGALDDASLGALGARGIRLLRPDAGSVELPPQPLDFAPPPTASVFAEGAITAIAPDPAVATLIGSTAVAGDPVLSAQWVLGELATIWLEQPGEARGIAVLLPDGLDLPGGFFGPFVRGVAGAPWLDPNTAAELAATFPPAAEPSALVGPVPSTFSDTYVDGLRLARRRIDAYRSMLVEETDEPERLETQLLLAESGDFLANPAGGLEFIDAVRDEVGDIFHAVEPDAGQVITLTSSTGSRIPVRVTNGNEEPLRVSVRLVSQHLRESPSSDITLEPGATTALTFDVDLKTTGRFEVKVQVVAPNGRVINDTSVIVRSTAYSRLALIVTLAAALVLFVVWARRFLPRRTT
jgi:hypothetical protein